MSLKERLNGKGTLVAVILALLIPSGSLIGSAIWVVNSNAEMVKSNNALSKEVAVVKNDVKHLADTVGKQMGDRFRDADWVANERWIRERFDNIDKQLDHIEKELDDHRTNHRTQGG